MKEKKPKRQLSSGLRLIVSGLLMGLTMLVFNVAGLWLDVEYEKEYWEITLTIVGFFVSLAFITTTVIKHTDENGLK